MRRSGMMVEGGRKEKKSEPIISSERRSLGSEEEKELNFVKKRRAPSKEAGQVYGGRRVVKVGKREERGSLSSVASDESLLKMGSCTSESSRGAEREVLRKAMFERVLEGKQALRKKMRRLL